jgi:phosphoserine phosphatase RsbX
VLDVAVAETIADGESVSGDMSLVARLPTGVLVAVVDGLGHGEEAAVAAREAVACLREGAGVPLPELFQTAHRRLAKTRGAVVSAALFSQDESSMSWLGVGNVEGQLLRADGAGREGIFLAGGVVGYRLPLLRPTSVAVEPGDTLVFATDGVAGDFSHTVDPRKAPAQLAESIIAAHSNGADDALVLVARA